MLYDVLYDEALLEDRPGDHLRLNGHLDLDPLGVGLRPDKVGVHEPDLAQVLEALETEGHQFTGLERADHPLVGRVQITLAEPAEVDDDLLGNLFRDVHLGAETRHARVGGVRLDGRAAAAAKTGWKRAREKGKMIKVPIYKSLNIDRLSLEVRNGYFSAGGARTFQILMTNRVIS